MLSFLGRASQSINSTLGGAIGDCAQLLPHSIMGINRLPSFIKLPEARLLCNLQAKIIHNIAPNTPRHMIIEQYIVYVLSL